jgi:hypothetical protein
LAEARRAYQLWQKEIELVRLHREIEALKLVIPLLTEERVACQIEYVTSDSDVRGLWKKEDGLGTQPPTMETYIAV